MLITFEGLDGSGKTTQAKLLYDFLREKNELVEQFKFPDTDTEEMKSLTGKLLTEGISKKEELAIMKEMFVKSIKRRRIKELLAEGYTIICDRFYHSTYVYQSTTVDEALEIQADMEKLLNLKPDLTILLSARQESLKKRLDNRGIARDKFESKDKTALWELEVRYKALEMHNLRKNKRSWEQISAEKRFSRDAKEKESVEVSKEDIHESITSFVFMLGGFKYNE